MGMPTFTTRFLLGVALLAAAAKSASAIAEASTAACAPMSGAAIRDKYFDSDWARQDGAAIDDAPNPPGLPAADGGQGLYAVHELQAHASITSVAYQLYAARLNGGGELGEYLPDVLAGAHDEDGSDMTPWGEWIPELRHFWDSTKGPFQGLFGCDSAVNRAQKYFTGGYGLDGAYDVGWSENAGKYRGQKGQGILYLYAHGDKHKAYWYLGHVAHLLEDLTVPAHALLWPHPFDGDAYERYMGAHYAEWAALPPGPLESFDSLYDLFYQTAFVTGGYDAGVGPGPMAGADGRNDRGARRAGGFTEAKLREEGDVLMPLAYRKVAALFLFFSGQVNRVPIESFTLGT